MRSCHLRAYRGETRAESSAGNVAYDYLRRYSNSATNPCTTQSPMASQSISVPDISDVRVTVTITCPQTDAPSLSEVESIVTYGNPSSTVRVATYVDKSKGASPDSEVTNGLIAWWKLNGSASSDVGAYSGTPVNVTPTTGQNGQPNTAMNFSGYNSYIQVPSGFSEFPGGMTVTVWARPTSAPYYARIFDFGNGQALGNIVWSRMDTSNDIYLSFTSTNGSSSANLNAPGVFLLNQWRFYAVTVTPGGAAVSYVNGSSVTSGTLPLPDKVLRTQNFIGKSNWTGDPYYAGAMDDLRIYGRALSASEITQLYTAGAK